MSKNTEKLKKPDEKSLIEICVSKNTIRVIPQDIDPEEVKKSVQDILDKAKT